MNNRKLKELLEELESDIQSIKETEGDFMLNSCIRKVKSAIEIVREDEQNNLEENLSKKSITKVYPVMHSMGMDGDHCVTIFSKEEDAQRLCDLYEKSSEHGSYDYYWYIEEDIDEFSIEDFILVEEDYINEETGQKWKTLLNTKEVSLEDYRESQRELYEL